MGMIDIGIYFDVDWVGDKWVKKNAEVVEVFKQHGGMFVNSGTYFGPIAERDICYSVPADQVTDLLPALSRIEGVRFYSRPDNLWPRDEHGRRLPAEAAK